MKYFNPIPNTLEELKKSYRKLAKKFHPDCGGNNKDMAGVNAEYETLFERLKVTNNRKATAGDKRYKYTDESAQAYMNIINELIKCNGLDIEVCGYWVWVTGDTYPHKDKLKTLNFRFSKSKKSWYLDTTNNNKFKHKRKKVMSMNWIRDTYGSEKYHAKDLNEYDIQPV